MEKCNVCKTTRNDDHKMIYRWAFLTDGQKVLNKHCFICDKILRAVPQKEFSKYAENHEVINDDPFSHPSFSEILKFGKYKGMSILDVWKKDLGYCNWIISEFEDGNQFKESFKKLAKIEKALKTGGNIVEISDDVYQIRF